MLPSATTYNWTSAGGFSNLFARPSYQDAAVNAYLSASHSQNNSHYNISGRAFPDVSAIGSNLTFVYEGVVDPIIGFGTSIATPLWGSILTLVNQRRLAAGKSVVGWVNPVLYAHPEVFNDVSVVFPFSFSLPFTVTFPLPLLLSVWLDRLEHRN